MHKASPDNDAMQYTVAVHFLRLLTDYCDANGLPASQLLESHGLPVELLEQPEKRIPTCVSGIQVGNPCVIPGGDSVSGKLCGSAQHHRQGHSHEAQRARHILGGCAANPP
mgnify:CR=1 FL=1